MAEGKQSNGKEIEKEDERASVVCVLLYMYDNISHFVGIYVKSGVECAHFDVYAVQRETSIYKVNTARSKGKTESNVFVVCCIYHQFRGTMKN